MEVKSLRLILIGFAAVSTSTLGSRRPSQAGTLSRVLLFTCLLFSLCLFQKNYESVVKDCDESKCRVLFGPAVCFKQSHPRCVCVYVCVCVCVCRKASSVSVLSPSSTRFVTRWRWARHAIVHLSKKRHCPQVEPLPVCTFAQV